MDFIKIIGVILVVVGIVGMSFWIWICLEIKDWLDSYEDENDKQN